MDTRLKLVLTNFARQYAPPLLAVFGDPHLSEQDHLGRIARGLAAYHLLVLVTDVVPSAQITPTRALQEWVNSYRALYNVLASNLFPSYRITQIYYTDPELPSIVVIYGQSVPLMHVLAGYIVPYVAARHARPGASEAELWGLMDIVLNQLAADDLPRREYNRVRAEAATIIKRLLALPLRQIALNNFDQPVLAGMDIQYNPNKTPDTSVEVPSSTPLEQLQEDEERAETGQHPPMAFEGQQSKRSTRTKQPSAQSVDLPELRGAGTDESLGVGGGHSSAAAPPPFLPEEEGSSTERFIPLQADAKKAEVSDAAQGEPPDPPTPERERNGSGNLRLPGTGNLRLPGTGPLRRPPIPDLPSDDD